MSRSTMCPMLMRPRNSKGESSRWAIERSVSTPTSARSPTFSGSIDATVKAFGRLDIMVNNAGIETRTSVLDTTEKQYEAVLRVNLKSAFFGTQLAAKQMIKQGGGGHIINITSVHEDWPMPGNIAYCLSKGGMRMLTRTAGVELAPHKILVAGVGPEQSPRPSIVRRWTNPAEMEKLDAAIPLGRMAQPEEIASVVAMLAERPGELHHGDHGVRRWRPDAEQPRAVKEESHAATLRRHHHRQRRWRRHAGAPARDDREAHSDSRARRLAEA